MSSRDMGEPKRSQEFAWGDGVLQDDQGYVSDPVTEPVYLPGLLQRIRNDRPVVYLPNLGDEADE